MAGDLNVVVLVGRLTRNAELKYSQNGMSSMLRFSIAVNSRRRGADGNWSDEPNFFDCVYFSKTAEAMSQYLEKGRQVAIQGELRQSRWEGQDGQARNRVEIFVNNLTLLSQSQSQGGRPQAAPSQSYSQNPVQQRQRRQLRKVRRHLSRQLPQLMGQTQAIPLRLCC